MGIMGFFTAHNISTILIGKKLSMIGQWPSAYLEVASTTDSNIMEQSESGNTNNSILRRENIVVLFRSWRHLIPPRS